LPASLFGTEAVSKLDSALHVLDVVHFGRSWAGCLWSDLAGLVTLVLASHICMAWHGASSYGGVYVGRVVYVLGAR
jgi:hypothetical protein